ncbi:MAG: protease modulator HflC [Gammaproteobacteria bacterium]|nr:protease modulator HflC [Gammaproteobacteria bacterium]
MFKSFGLTLLVIVVVGFWSTVFYVDERELAIKFKFGEIVESDYKPGIHFKIPLVHNVRKFDKRILTIDAKAESFFTGEKKDLIVDLYVKWRIKDVVEYFKTTNGDELRAGSLLYQTIKKGLRDEFGKRTIQEVVAGDRTEIMGISTEQAQEKAKTLGIEVVDVRIKRIDLPASVSSSVYNRMRAERERVARDFRSKGAESAERIRADADRQSKVLLAEAYRDSEIVRGEGDALAADIYAKAYGKNEEFYRFYRSMDAYKNTFSGKQDVMLIDPNSDFFNYFKSATGKPR